MSEGNEIGQPWIIQYATLALKVVQWSSGSVVSCAFLNDLKNVKNAETMIFRMRQTLTETSHRDCF